ncbi:MAG: hypothetical protein COB07_01585 [Sulfurovum sp.]|nr:MAG: hypothetical protein COB07_01585 [Sulfurovum sp.]
MNEHFITNIEIKNFKCFENFKAEGFGRVNLIGGKNNVGKTAFMEACYIEKQYTSKAIYDIILSRYSMSLLDELLNDIGQKYIFNFIQDKAKEITGGTVLTNFNQLIPCRTTESMRKPTPIKITYNKDELEKEDISISFLNTSIQSSFNYNKLYSKVIEFGLEDELDKLIQGFDNTVDKFRIIQSKPKCSYKNNKQFYDLNEFGDGLGKFVFLICLLMTKHIIYLDEIENGIHHTNLDKLWEIILTISKQQNVQVFATTHSKECIESYARVAKKLDETDIKFLSLYRNKENELKSITFDYEKIQDRIELGLDNR